MRILDFLSAGTIKVDLAGPTKEAVIQELAGLLAIEGKTFSEPALVAAVLKREESVSTAIGEGVCVPHAKVEGILSACMAIGICSQGIPCCTPDSKPVKVIFLIVSSPNDAGTQLKILAALARYVKTPGFVSSLESSKSPQDVLDVLGKFEEVVRL